MSASTGAYQEFLDAKKRAPQSLGRPVDPGDIHGKLFPFQRDLTRWSIRKGRAAIFADTGLGKTYMQLEWARLIGGRSLVVAPLSVARQTVRLAADIGLEPHYTRSGDDLADSINVTNYEMLEHFNPGDFSSVVLDESSILKSLDGKTRRRLTEMFGETTYRLCCTATPAPNDIAEIANHAEFLGIMTRAEMLASFFVHDDEGWRLKGHAAQPFYRWLASWGMSVRKPSDLGYDDDGFILPPLRIEPLWVDTDVRPDGALFFTGIKGIQDRSKIRKATTRDRVSAAADLVTSDSDQWILWCGLNDEAASLAKMIPGAVNVQGADSPESKAAAFEGFQDGAVRVLITKARIGGFGMNFQNCHKMAFVGLNDSWEGYYQCIRRCYRFGQTQPVDVYIVLTEPEAPIYENVMRKEREAKRMADSLVEHVREFEREEITDSRHTSEYETAEAGGEGWRLLLGDSCERLREIPDDSIHLSVFSPPFASLYTYSPSERDLGNSSSQDEFFSHFRFIAETLLRKTMPGRVAAVHVADVPAMLVRDGYIGLKDFSGEVIRLFQGCGWVFDGRVPIDKNQQAQSIRTHSKALTMTQMKKDRSWLRPALPDYILKLRKPGENPQPVAGGMSGDEWIDLANPTWPGDGDRCADWGSFATWYGISESDTLNAAEARENDDERHICPLQLGTIERCIRLWTNEGETVLSPFAGIGSEGYVALRLGRRFVGIELKEAYFRAAVRNVGGARLAGQASLFDEVKP